MSDFSLDPRLKNDCVTLGKLDLSLILLMNNSLAPWFILVPETTVNEVFDLSHPDQARLLKEINLVSSFIRSKFNSTKLNTAAIGNIVNQLHIHIVGRDPADFCWPDVVWGSKDNKPYSDKRIEEITCLLESHLGGQFTVIT